MEQNYQIKKLGQNDGPLLKTFYNSLSTQTRHLFRPVGWTMSQEDVTRILVDLQREKRYDVVVRQEQTIKGWAFLDNLMEAHADLGIGLSEEVQGRGLGSALMQNLVREAERRKTTVVDLIVVQENLLAQKLYEKFGFRTVGTRTGQDGLAYFAMQLNLSHGG